MNGTCREELKNLVSLLDDRDTVVSGCVHDRLLFYGQDAVDTLLSLRDSERDPGLRALVSETAEEINSELKLKIFNDTVGNTGVHLSLFEGSWLVCSMLDPSLRRDEYEDLFFRCSSEYVAESSDQRTAVENIRVFNHIFFHRLHFAIYDVEMRDTGYAMIDQALRTRRGNPFAIAYIYMMVAGFAGLPLKVVAFPGGFVPVYVESGKELFYINVYRNGEIFLKDRLKEFISAVGLPVNLSEFQLKDEKTLLTIYMESLHFIFSNMGDERKCLTLSQALESLGSERFLSMDEEA